MKIGIFGGSFNPIHNGHINILNGFKEVVGFDKLFVIPSNISPHKRLASMNNEDRIKMCELALAENKVGAEVSTIEIDRGEVSYTVDTLYDLKEIYQNDELYFIMGEDMFLTVDRWMRADEIFKLCTICCAKRSHDGDTRLRDFGESLKAKHKDFKYLIHEIDYVEVSSTEIRNGKLDGIPNSVLEYIKNNNIYQEAIVNE